MVAFLSGGIDSSTVVALMQAQSSRLVKTFSIGSDVTNEAVFARQVARYLGTEHTELYVSPREAMEVIPRLCEIYNEPFSDSSQIPTLLLSKLSRQHVTVCLSGDGGYELFGGYKRHFLVPTIWCKFGWIYPEIRTLASKGMQSISPVTLNKAFYKLNNFLPKTRRLNSAWDNIQKFSEILPLKSPTLMYIDLCSHWKTPGI